MQTQARYTTTFATRQRGVSLLVVTVLMLAIILMTLTAFYVSKTQYKLVGNIQSSELAFNQAEAVDAAGRAWVNVPANAKSPGFDAYNASATAHLYPSGKLTSLGLTPATMTWTDANSLASGNGRYLIELLGRNVHKPGDSLAVGQSKTSCKSVDLFRVVSKADAGQSGSRIIETIEAVSGC